MGKISFVFILILFVSFVWRPFGLEQDSPNNGSTDTLFVTENSSQNSSATQSTPVSTEDKSATIEVRVISSADDAEEVLSTNEMNLTSTDLELVEEKSEQAVGIRFTDIDIPRLAVVTKAYVQFVVDEVSSIDTFLSIHGEAVDHSIEFTEAPCDISSRQTTSASVSWNPAPWLVVGEAGPDQQTPDITVVVQEIINRDGWGAGNSLTLIITGSGVRLAESFNGESYSAPLLFIEYQDLTSTPTPGATSTPKSNVDAISFAVIGDFGKDGEKEAQVAALVHGWNPDFVITTGDNNYPDGEAATIDANIGKYYSGFIGDYQGSYGPGSATNRFWPSLGNHDWHTISCTGDVCEGAYFDYFTLPHNKRYYEIDLGLVHLFALNSNSEEPDGSDASSTQANWLQNQLVASTSCYNLVYFHHSPYSSGRHGSSGTMQWPFATWGADAVLTGHDHLYERIEADGIPYFVNGAGGSGLYKFEHAGDLPPEATSVLQYNEDNGAMLVTATLTQIKYQFNNTSGALIYDYTVPKDCPVPTPTPSATPNPTFTSTPSPTLTPTQVPIPATSNVPGDATNIQAGIDMGVDSDTVLVAPGHYFENITIADKTITLASRFHTTGNKRWIEESIIDGNEATVIKLDKSAGPDNKIIGFTIQNGEDGVQLIGYDVFMDRVFRIERDLIRNSSGRSRLC